MKALILTCALLAAGARSSATAQTPGWEKPVRTVFTTPVTNAPIVTTGGYPSVDVTVNGTPMRFGLETGGALIAVSTRAASALGLKVEPSGRAAGQGPQGIATLDSIRIGGVKFEGVRAGVTASIEGRGFDGIVTPALLRDVLYTIDLRRNNLRLERGALPAINGTTIIPIARADRGGRIDIPLRIGNATVAAVLDTQAEFEVILADSLESLIGFREPPQSIGEAYGPSQGTFTMRGGRVRDVVRVAGTEFEALPVTLRNRPGPVVGLAFLEQFVITVDDANGRVRLVPNSSPIRIATPSWERARRGPPPAGVTLAGPTGARPAAPAAGYMLGLRTDASRVVGSVEPGSNIEKAGIKSGDVFEEIEGRSVASLAPQDFAALLASGAPVNVTLTRDGKPYSTKVTLVPRAPDAGAPVRQQPQAQQPQPQAQPQTTQQPQASTGDLRAEIERINAAMVDAHRRGDPLAIAAFYTDDARIIGARGTAAEGREAVNRYWQSFPSTATWSLEVKDVGGTRDLVYQLGRSTVTNGGMSQAVDWVGIWRRQPDGQLKLVIDYFVAAPRQ